MSDMEAWVEWYEANGLVYFPLYGILNGACRCREGAACDNAGKHPMFKWKDQPRRMPTDADNVGVSTDNLVVVDIDIPDMTSVLDYPDTFTTTTGHGYHLWYRASPKKAVKSLVGWKRKVDIRAVGGLVVAPPSRHRNGANYMAMNDHDIKVIPDDLLYQLPERTANYNRTGRPVEVTLDQTPEFMFPMVKSLVTDMLNWTDGRNVTLFRLACRFYEMTAKNMLGGDALDELFAAAVQTGLTADEIERTLASAKRSV